MTHETTIVRAEGGWGWRVYCSCGDTELVASYYQAMRWEDEHKLVRAP